MREMPQQIRQCTTIAIEVGKITARTVNGQKRKQSQEENYSPNCPISLYVFKNVFHYSIKITVTQLYYKSRLFFLFAVQSKSPFQFYRFLIAALNCLPLSSKFSNKSKLAQAGDSKTVLFLSANLWAICTASGIESAS